MSIDNDSISEMKQKLGLDPDLNKKRQHNSMASIPKNQMSVEEKLPLKRKGLNKDLREIYRSIINSKDHGNYQELACKLTEKEKPKEKVIIKGFKSKQQELKNMMKEEEAQLIEENIKAKGIKDFQKKIALYNITHGSYLIPPEDKYNSTHSVGKVPKFTETPKIVFDPRASINSLVSKGSILGKSPVNNNSPLQRGSTTKSGVIQIMRDFELEDRVDSNKASRRSKENFFVEEKPRQISQASDLRRMRDLEQKIPRKKTLNENEELALKAVKEGNERELWSLLETHPELIKTVDNVREF